MTNKGMLKLAAAAVMFVAAAMLIAWDLGWFSPAPPPAPTSDRVGRPHPGGGAQMAPGAGKPAH